MTRFNLHADELHLVFDQCDSSSKLNLILASERFLIPFATSFRNLKNFTLDVDEFTFDKINNHQNILQVPFVNISVKFVESIVLNEISNLMKNYKNSTQNLTLKDFKIEHFSEFLNFFNKFKSLAELALENCHLGDDLLPEIPTLKSVSIYNCKKNIFEILKLQKNVEKIKIQSYDYTWKGFSHKKLNKLVENLRNFNHLILIGDGTSSYFDRDEFPFKIKILETTSINFHWYVGILTARLNFLVSQLGILKELTIHKLPFDFNGGNVLKFIIEDMQLDKFYYGKIPLILNGTKQEVLDFTATEVQIEAAFEMFRQFPTIQSFTLIINNTDICSDAIDKVINPKTYLFDKLDEFKLIDKSGFRGLFGVFLGFFKNLRNIKKLTFDTQDRNILVILEECLPKMRNLEEICLTSKLPNSVKRFEIIKKLVKGLKKLTIPAELVTIAEKIFDIQVEIVEIQP
ncbi:hypothetical protein ACKWTF_014406 [Chironomus riparius]